MYVRWQLYKSKARAKWERERNDKRARLKAILVKNVRINGKPVQKHIAFLGSMETNSPLGEEQSRFWFWYRVTIRLNQLSNRLSRAERARIGAAIAKKVPGQLLTKAQLRAAEQRRQETLEGLRSLRLP
jgi:hypothetical protein